MKTARRPLGPVMIDLSGCELSRDEQRWLTHPNMGGVILFARNFRDRAQLAALTVQIRSIRHDALIAVDHEGGRVQRFRSDGFTHLPRCAGSANAGTMMRRSPRAQRPPPAIYWLRNYGPAALISALRRFST